MSARVIVLSDKPIATLDLLIDLLTPITQAPNPTPIVFQITPSNLCRRDVDIQDDGIIVSSINSEIESSITKHRRLAQLTLLLKDDVFYIKNSDIPVLDGLSFINNDDCSFSSEHLPSIFQFLYLKTRYDNTVARAVYHKNLRYISH